ncbi:MAG: nucleotidyltransferase domain-containing protein [Bacillota bacterium]
MLQEKELLAIQALKENISNKYSLDSITLFGSKARGDDNLDSDIDLLVLLNQTVTTPIEEAIFDMAYEQELAHSSIIGIIVYDKTVWDGIGRSMPLRWNIDREGVAA